MVKYIKVDWPESQNYTDPWICEECYPTEDGAIMVPEEIWEKMEKSKLYPATVTINLGEMVITEDEITLNGKRYSRHLPNISPGKELILYSLDDGYRVDICPGNYEIFDWEDVEIIGVEI